MFAQRVDKEEAAIRAEAGVQGKVVGVCCLLSVSTRTDRLS